jgi:hypothetical protein
LIVLSKTHALAIPNELSRDPRGAIHMRFVFLARQ